MPTLTKENHLKWFKTLELIARKESVMFLLTHEVEEYCRVLGHEEKKRLGVDTTDGNWTPINGKVKAGYVYNAADKEIAAKDVLWENTKLRKEFESAEAGFLINLLTKINAHD